VKTIDVPASENMEAKRSPFASNLPPVSFKDYFLKEKGDTKVFHQEWLEMRGFYLLWYTSPKDRIARGVDLLSDCAIRV
jgi:hypothetical protein